MLVSPHPALAYPEPAETTSVFAFLRLVLLLSSSPYLSEVNPEVIVPSTFGIPPLVLSLLSLPGAQFNQQPKRNCTGDYLTD